MADLTKKFTDLNPDDEPIADTDFCRFLTAHGTGDRRLDDITAYLGDHGFCIGLDTVSRPVLDTLKLIHDYYCTRHYRAAQKSREEEIKNRIAELEQVNATIQRSADHLLAMRAEIIKSRDTWVDMWLDENNEKLELQRKNGILQEQLDMMAAKYRPQE